MFTSAIVTKLTSYNSNVPYDGIILLQKNMETQSDESIIAPIVEE